MKRRLIAILAVLAIVGVSAPANAGVIAGASGSSYKAGSGAQHFYDLGTGMSGNLNSVYVTINDASSAGWLVNFNLIECSTSAYNSPGFACGNTTYTAVTTVGGTTWRTIALTGNSKRTVKLDFTIHTPAGGGVGTATPIVIDPTKFYRVYFSGSSSQTVDNANRGVNVYGITTQLTDTYGNPIRCGTTTVPFNACDATMKTPYFVLSDTSLTSDEIAAFGGAATVSFPGWLNPTPWFVASGSNYGLTSSSSLTGADLGYFGNMLRDLALFLFSPWDETTANAWTNFRGSLSVHVPFSYVAETVDMINTASVASGSMPSWTFSNTALGLASVSFFSASTITAYAPSGFLAALRTIIQVGLWMGLLMFFYRTATGIWHSSK